jgi:outer membrane protein TolC
VADNNISLRAAIFYPRVWLSAGYNYNERELKSNSPRFEEDLFKSLSRNTSVGLNLSFNLFNGMQDKIDLQNAHLEARNQSLALQDSEYQLAGLVREVLETFYKRMELIALEEQNVIAAQKNLQLNQDRYNIGAASSLEFRDAQINLIRSQSTLIVARFQARITRLELEQLMGSWEIPKD